MKRVMWLAGLCCLLALGLMLWGFAVREAPAKPASGHCLLLVEQDTGSDLLQLRRGLEAALRQEGLRLRVERLQDTPFDAPPPWLAEARVVYLLAEQAAEPAALLKALGKPLVLLGQGLPGEACVVSDEKLGGLALGSHLATSEVRGQLLLLGQQGDSLQQQRAQGLASVLPGWQLRWLNTQDSLESLTESLKENLSETRALVALSTQALEQAAGLKRSAGLRLPLYGFDGADSRVQLMEEGLLSGVVASNLYAMGYAAGQLLSPRVGQELSVAPRLVTLEGLYLAENAQLMFPLLP